MEDEGDVYAERRCPVPLTAQDGQATCSLAALCELLRFSGIPSLLSAPKAAPEACSGMA